MGPYSLTREYSQNLAAGHSPKIIKSLLTKDKKIVTYSYLNILLGKIKKIARFLENEHEHIVLVTKLDR